MKISKMLSILMAGVGFAAGSANGALIIEEQFNYGPGEQGINGQNGGTGFAGPWVTSPDSFGGRAWLSGIVNYAAGPGSFVNADGGLDFPGLATAGAAASRFGTAGQRVVERPFSQSGLTADGTSIWFSVLTAAPNGNKFGAIVFGTERQITRPTPELNLVAAGEGFGITYTASGGGSGTGSPNAVAFDDSISSTIVNGSFTPSFTAGDTHHATSLIVGKVNWNAAGTADELFLFNVTDPSGSAPAEGSAIASISGDFNQANFDTLSMWDTGSSIFDEIRFGNTFSDVTPVPEPSGVALFGLSGLVLIMRRRR